MNNTTRDRTEERRDRDNSDAKIMPPQKPAADDSSHVPGGATEMAELNRALEEETGEKGLPKKAP